MENTHGRRLCQATAIGGLPLPVAAIVLPRPVRACFPDLESRNFNRLLLISLRLARTRASEEFLAAGPVAFPRLRLARTRASEGGRPSSQCAGRAAPAGLTGGESIG